MITKASPVVVELLFIPLLDVYNIPSRSQLIDWAEALAFILVALCGFFMWLLCILNSNPQ